MKPGEGRVELASGEWVWGTAVGIVGDFVVISDPCSTEHPSTDVPHPSSDRWEDVEAVAYPAHEVQSIEWQTWILRAREREAQKDGKL